MPAVAGTYFPVTVHRALTEGRQRLFIKRAFRQHVPEGVAARILADPSILRFGGERKEFSILFFDVRSLTRATRSGTTPSRWWRSCTNT